MEFATGFGTWVFRENYSDSFVLHTYVILGFKTIKKTYFLLMIIDKISRSSNNTPMVIIFTLLKLYWNVSS